MNATTRKRGGVLCFTGLLMVSWVFGGGWAHAEILYDKDGIQLRGTAQLVQSGGGTCNVLESDTNFEEKQANHGAPMDIWRLDFSVHNGSPRWLDHLIARFQIASEWPECTNWDVPHATEFASQYPSALIEWGGSAGHIQKSGRNVVSPSQTLTDTKLLIVLRGDPEPQFSNWSLNYDFATHPPPPGAPSPAAASADRPAATSEQESLFWQSILGCTNPSDFETYLKQFPNGSFRTLAENLLAVLRQRPERTPSGEALRVDSPADSGESDFGDDTGRWAKDGECDDPRFEGPGMGLTDSEEALGHDATDCRELVEAGLIRRTNVDTVGPSTNPATAGGQSPGDRSRRTPATRPLTDRNTTASAAGGPCLIPGYPSPPGGVANLGLPWCPATVGFQARAFALQAAGAQCAISTGSASTPELIRARRQEIQTACAYLAALGVSNCRCP